MTTTQVHIKTRCNYCEGKAYLPYGEQNSGNEEFLPRYLPCPICQGTGLESKWISLTQLRILIDAIDPMESDYSSWEDNAPISQYQDSCESAGI